MAGDVRGRNRVAVDPIKLGVLGGTFTVKEVYAASVRDADAVVEQIRSTDADRWFVMLAEGRETSLDVLALIDDGFEFQSIATGILETD